MTKLTVQDGLQVGFCVKGQRQFCKLHGLDFRDFLRNGIDVREIENIDDSHLKRAIAVARSRGAEL